MVISGNSADRVGLLVAVEKALSEPYASSCVGYARTSGSSPSGATRVEIFGGPDKNCYSKKAKGFIDKVLGQSLGAVLEKEDAVAIKLKERVVLSINPQGDFCLCGYTGNSMPLVDAKVLLRSALISSGQESREHLDYVLV